MVNQAIGLNNYHRSGIFLPILGLSTIDIEPFFGLGPWRDVSQYNNLLWYHVEIPQGL